MSFGINDDLSVVGNLSISGNILGTSTFANLLTANALVTGGSLTNITGAASTFRTSNFSSPNAQITGGNITNVANVSVTGNLVVNGQNINQGTITAMSILFGL